MSNASSTNHHTDEALIQQGRDQLAHEGYLPLSAPLEKKDLAEIYNAVKRLETQFPFGFVNKGVYAGQRPEPRPEAPKPSDYAPTIIYPNVGFMEPALLAPLKYEAIHNLVKSVIGDDYYFSNTWLQNVPPGTGRLAFHKDPRGSISFVLLLDDIDDDMGSTCLVPKSHLNTPPAAFCMNDIQKPHPKEIDLCGKAGDIVFFSPETWHARATNNSSMSTRRLFYNFYSRSCKATTSWAGGVLPEEVKRVQESLPEPYRKMFFIDAKLAVNLQNTLSPIELANGADSHSQFFPDIKHSRRFYGKSCIQLFLPNYTIPYTTRLMESSAFSLSQYLSCLKPIPTAKIIVRSLLEKITKSTDAKKPNSND